MYTHAHGNNHVVVIRREHKLCLGHTPTEIACHMTCHYNPLRLNYATPPSAAQVADERDVAVSVHPDIQPVHFCPKSR